jgi:polysaccharide pyruvyl transferase WcaK-like protein
MNAPTITFFGNFGTHNLGNEVTLEAMIQNTRAHLPAARLNCVCSEPFETTRAHGIPAFRISYRYGRRPSEPPQRPSGWLRRLLRRVFVRLPRELLEWLRAFRTLRDTTMLVMTGTGMLGDFGIGPLDLHYEILKWSIVAKLRRRKLLFVSVGAGPIAHPLSRWIVKRALSLADYRSYRDTFSKEYLESIGFDTSGDRVYPDLAFSLANAPSSNGHRAGHHGRLIGLGLMDYYGQHLRPEEGERVYQRYVADMARFARWLIEQGYSLLLLIGDVSYDTRVKRDVLNRLRGSGCVWDDRRIIEQPLSSPEELGAQLARTEIVVATRFHNVLLALLLDRPVIALSYHEKVHSLMAGVGAAAYCHDATTVDVPRLIEQFKSLEANADSFRSTMRATTVEYRRALDEQYRHIFGRVRS